MMVKRLIPLTVLAFLATAPTALAKEQTARICGAGGCLTASALAYSLNSAGRSVQAPKPAPFYTVRVKPRGSYVYVPRAKANLGTGFGGGRVRWTEAFQGPTIDSLMRGIEPYPASPTWTAGVPARGREFSLTAAICGSGGCVTSRRSLGSFVTNGPRMAAPRPEPFYVVHVVRVSSSRRAAPTVGALGRSLWSYVYAPRAKASRGNPFGEERAPWTSVWFQAPIVRRLTKDLKPYPASATWAPSMPGRGGGFPAGWVVLSVLAGSLVLVLALWRLGRLPFPTGRRRPAEG